MQWTEERIAQLQTPEIKQLRANAERLGEAAVLALCDTALELRPRGRAKNGAAPARRERRHLISRAKAFQARGVYLAQGASSWSGVRKSDGVVVMSLWASSVRSNEGGCSQLLWAPNVDGSRPWSDKPAGKERLAHCKLALEQGSAEGLLVHGQSLEGHLAEEKARSVYGVDPEIVVHFRVEKRGEEYWAVWGSKTADRPL
jgi:hypothetical protein